MAVIHSDAQFKTALAKLSLDQQRRVGALFVAHVVELADNPRIKTAIAVADEADSSMEQIAEGFRTAKAMAVTSYAVCGREADWLKQASHFVAAAAATCFTPEDQVEQCRELAWNTAMNARLARVCESIAHGQAEQNKEPNEQYEMLETYLETH